MPIMHAQLKKIPHTQKETIHKQSLLTYSEIFHPPTSHTHNYQSLVYLRQLWTNNVRKHVCNDEVLSCVCGMRVTKYVHAFFTILIHFEQTFHISLPNLIAAMVITRSFTWHVFGSIFRQVFTLIDNKFLVSGHIYLPCDCNFALGQTEKKMVVLLIVCSRVVGGTCTQHKTHNPFDIMGLKT